MSVGTLHRVTLRYGIGLHCFSTKRVNVDLSRAAKPASVNMLLCVFTKTTKGSCVLGRTIPRGACFSPGFTHASRFLRRSMFGGCRARARLVHCVAHLKQGSISLTRSVVSLNSYAVGLGPTSAVLPLDHPRFVGVRPCTPRSRIRNCARLVRGLSTCLYRVAKFGNYALRPGSKTTNRCANLHMVQTCLRDVKRKRHGVILLPTSTRNAGPTDTIRYNFAAIAIGYSSGKGVSLRSFQTGTRTGGSGLTTDVVACPSARNVFRISVGRVYSVIRTYNNRLCVSNTGVGTRINLAGPNAVNTSIYRLGLRGAFSSPRKKNNPNINPVYITTRLIPFLPRRPVL